MAETTEKTGDKKLSVTPNKTLSLKGRGVEHGMVKQSFSHGRTKTVVVEKVRNRAAPAKGRLEPVAPEPAKRPPTPAPGRGSGGSPGQRSSPAGKPSGLVLRPLTEEEQKARVHALADAALRDAE